MPFMHDMFIYFPLFLCCWSLPIAWKQQIKSFSHFQPPSLSSWLPTQGLRGLSSYKEVTKCSCFQNHPRGECELQGEHRRGASCVLWQWWRKAQAVLDHAQLLACGRMDTCHQSIDSFLGLNKVVPHPQSGSLMGALDRNSATNLPQSGSDTSA